MSNENKPFGYLKERSPLEVGQYAEIYHGDQIAAGRVARISGDEAILNPYLGLVYSNGRERIEFVDGIRG